MFTEADIAAFGVAAAKYYADAYEFDIKVIPKAPIIGPPPLSVSLIAGRRARPGKWVNWGDKRNADWIWHRARAAKL